MAGTLDSCARELLEVMPLVLQDLRRTLRSHSTPDLRFPELRSLVFLRHNPGSNLTDLAEYIGVSLPSMSKLVDNMTYRGLIDRQPDAEDRRRVCLGLTESGLSVLAVALDAVKASFAVRLTQLDSRDIDLVYQGLNLLHRLFGGVPEGGEELPGSEASAS
jgi:MarR family transcriptional regulator for hemolysin